ncbi:MAG: c-type cytochrome [Methylobacter sp.]
MHAVAMIVRGIAALCLCWCVQVCWAQPADRAEIERGAYLARIGDCVACHTAGPRSPPFAGGGKLNSPFGVIYSTNITPDPDYGIGRYTLDDFSRAVRDGVDRNGNYLYPAMPFPSFAKISDEDIRALYAYFMNDVPPFAYKSPETKLPFPFNIRFNLALWDALFVGQQRFKPRADKDTQWNRGAYLVQSLGHCGTCHTPRGLAFQEKGYDESSPAYLKGGILDNWFASNLTGDFASGLGRWRESDIVDFLETGHNDFTAASGTMIEVVENSTQYLRRDDLKAIAHYLKSLPAGNEPVLFKPDLPDVPENLAAIVTGEVERPGVGLYQSFCAKCHQETGIGEPGKYPRLAGNSNVLAENPVSLIHLLLKGSKTARTRAGGKSQEMPSFAEKFSDRQIADVLSFIRNSWGNLAPRVAPRDVTKLRRELQVSPTESGLTPTDGPNPHCCS